MNFKLTTTPDKWAGRPPRRLLFRVAALISALGLGFIIAEVTLRLFLTGSYRATLDYLDDAIPNDPKKNVGLYELMRRDANPRLLYRLKSGAQGYYRGFAVRLNESGFRDEAFQWEKPEKTLRVVGLGDSTMFGHGVGMEDCYLELLEEEARRLMPDGWRAEFLNMAAPGYNAMQEVEMFFESGLKAQPDAVLIQFDRNDLQRPVGTIKPDFIFARKSFALRPLQIARGYFAGDHAFFVLNQENRLFETDEAARWKEVELSYERLARVCRESGIPLAAMRHFQDWPLIDWQPPATDVWQRMTEICEKNQIPIIDTIPFAKAYLRKTGEEWEDLIFGGRDDHPTRTGHALMAQAGLSWVRRSIETILAKNGESVRDEPIFGNHALQRVGAEGLHETEDWGGIAVTWTAQTARFEVYNRGARAIFPMLVKHTDASVEKPVKVMIQVDGAPVPDGPITASNMFEFTGESFQECGVAIGELSGETLRVTIAVDRVYKTNEDPRALGGALYPIKFE